MYLLLLFLSTVHCHCEMTVFIEAETKETKASIRAYCEDSGRTTDLDLETFELTPAHIKCKLERVGVPRPDFVEAKKASNYGFTDLQTHLRISGAKVVNVQRETIVIFDRVFVNNSSKPTTVDIAVDEQLLEKINTRWFPSHELSIGKNMFINFRGKLFETAFNKNEKLVGIRKLSTVNNHDMTVKPWQNITMTLTAVKIRLDISVEYISSLTGDIFCQNRLFFIPLSWTKFDVNDYFKLVKSKTVLTSGQLIFLDYHFGIELQVKDGRTGAPLLDPIEVK